MIGFLNSLKPYLPSYLSPLTAFGVGCGLIGLLVGLLVLWPICRKNRSEKPPREPEAPAKTLGRGREQTIKIVLHISQTALVVLGIYLLDHLIQALWHGDEPLIFDKYPLHYGPQLADAAAFLRFAINVWVILRER